MNAYEVHKRLINTYVLQRRGDTSLMRRDSSRDKTDLDILRENHKFLWDDQPPTTWEENVSKRYYDKLFKEYCICDLTFYKENKLALRWRTEQEVVNGKGQFSCGAKRCEIKDGLKSWEVTFGYIEQGVKKSALVKIRLCAECSEKLNHRSKKRQVKRLKKKLKSKGQKDESTSSDKNVETEEKSKDDNVSEDEVEDGDLYNKQMQNPWLEPVQVNEKSREEEIDDYLADLLL